MMLIAGKGLDGWFGVRSQSVAAGSVLEQLVFSGFLIVGFTILVKRRFAWYHAMKQNAWVTIILCYMLISIVWSDVPFISVKRWIKELVAVIMGFVILSEADPRKALESVLRRFVYILIPLSLLLIIYFPDYGILGDPKSDLYMWTGVATHKNHLGRICFVSVLVLSWSLMRRREGYDVSLPRSQAYIDIFVLGIALFLMKGPSGVQVTKAISATSIVALVGGMAVFVGLLLTKRLERNIGLNTLRTVVVGCIVLGTVSVLVGGLVVGESVTAVVGREESLTGRDVMWAKFLRHAMMEPIVGHGIGGFWTDAIVNRYYYYSAHNGYLDIILNYGFLGLLLFSSFLLSACRRAHEEMLYDNGWGSLWFSLLLMALMYNVAESSLESFTGHLTAIILFFYVSSEAPFTELNDGIS